MPSESFYIDTDMLIFYFEKAGSDKAKTSRETIYRIKRLLDNSEIQVRIPQVVLGELLFNSCKDKCDPERMVKLLTQELGADFPSFSSEILECAQELMSSDRYLDPNDAVLAAHALMDMSTTWLFTTDPKLIGNLKINEKMIALEHRFTIASSFQAKRD